MEFFIASDHAAFEGKEQLKSALSDFTFVDLGVNSPDRANYPQYAAKLAGRVSSSNGQGILLCGSGIGVSMVANRFKGIRAALVSTAEEAKLSKQHNNANVLCMGARLRSVAEMEEMVRAWVSSSFEGGRHSDRIDMFNQLGENPESAKS